MECQHTLQKHSTCHISLFSMKKIDKMRVTLAKIDTITDTDVKIDKTP
jgi:hypothetical protein